MVSRRCKQRNDKGEQCGAAPLRDGDFCLFHDPAHAETVQEARKAGGQRRKREVASCDDLNHITIFDLVRQTY